MAARDPETGQFVSSTGAFDDYEVVSFQADAGVEAANVGGGTGFTSGSNHTFEGAVLVDYDEIVDRNERLHLLEAQHRIVVYANSTETEDGTVTAYVEISTAPVAQMTGSTGTGFDYDGGDDVVGNEPESDDSIDVIGRPLSAMAGAPFSDTATGVGGAGTQGDDSVVVSTLPGPMAEFHPRDELFLNGEIEVWNIDDAGVHVDIVGQHVYGVTED